MTHRERGTSSFRWSSSGGRAMSAKYLRLGLLAATMGVGCGYAGGEALGADADSGGPFMGADGGIDHFSDASGGRAPDGAAPSPSAFENGGADLASCYDGMDNNDDTLADCSDDACAALPSCCIGRVRGGSCCM